MQDEEADTRKTLNFYILFQISPALGVFPSHEPPLLGEEFAISTRKLFDALSTFRSKGVKHLLAIPLDQLKLGLTDRGMPKTLEPSTGAQNSGTNSAGCFVALARGSQLYLTLIVR